MPRGVPKKPVLYHRRCRYCHHIFETTQSHAKYCPGTDHRWLHWESLHPRRNAPVKVIRRGSR